MSRIALLLLAAAALPAPAPAQSSFEGVIVSRLHAGGKPMETTTSYKGTRSRMEMREAEGAYQLFDGAKGSMTAVMPEQKMYMVMDFGAMAGEGAERGEKPDKRPEIRPTGRTETIAGHQCEHYLITSDGEEMDVCAAKGLGFFGVLGGNPMAQGRGRGAASVPLEHRALYEQFKDGFQPLKIERLAKGKRELMMEVVSVEKKSLPAELFEIPAGYQKMDMGGMMGRMPRMPRPPR